MSDPTNSDNIVDVRDVIARYEELSAEFSRGEASRLGTKNISSLAKLLNELCGAGGDEQWRGDWYPVTLIRDDYFEQYARDLADDIGAINRDATWPNTHIDWEAAARDLQQDYSSVEWDGVTYWYR